MKPLDIPTIKSMPTKVYEYVRDCPGCTSRDIVADLDMRAQTVRMALKRFQNKGMLRTEGRDSSTGLRFWFMSDGTKYIPSQAQIKQETVTSWPALEIAKQNPWSALGL